MQFTNVTCPHCGLLCDDLVLDVEDQNITLVNVKDTLCQKAISDSSLDANDKNIGKAFINGEMVDLDQAITHAASLLRDSRLSLVSGLITDIGGARASIELADQCTAIVDHAYSHTLMASVATMQRSGMVTSTFSEVRNRADCVVVVGSGVFKKFPRFIERVLSPKAVLGDDQAGNKRIYVLDPESAGPLSEDLSGLNAQQIKLAVPNLDAIVHLLHGVLTQSEDEQCIENNELTKELCDLRKVVLASNYSTIVWTSSEFQTATTEISVQTLNSAVKHLTAQVRCVGLPLSGSRGEITANSVCTWQTGMPLRSRFRNGAPQHDPVLYDGSNLLKENQVSALVWVACYSPDDVPPSTDVPTIAIAHPKMSFTNTPEVFIPTGVPGLDHAGLACRADSVATLPLQAVRSNLLPSAKEVIQKIAEQLAS